VGSEPSALSIPAQWPRTRMRGVGPAASEPPEHHCLLGHRNGSLPTNPRMQAQSANSRRALPPRSCAGSPTFLMMLARYNGSLQVHFLKTRNSAVSPHDLNLDGFGLRVTDLVGAVHHRQRLARALFQAILETISDELAAAGPAGEGQPVQAPSPCAGPPAPPVPMGQPVQPRSAFTGPPDPDGLAGPSPSEGPR
jgi:hypothetical protein